LGGVLTIAVHLVGICPALPTLMTPKELQERTLVFSLEVYQLVKPWLKAADTRHVGLQLFRCSTAMAANYRAACLARSPKEFTAKIGVVREEADESLFWIIFIERSGMGMTNPEHVVVLSNEAGQLARIFAAAYRTSRTNVGSRRPART
jgi:four helix bundle protein